MSRMVQGSIVDEFGNEASRVPLDLDFGGELKSWQVKQWSDAMKLTADEARNVVWDESEDWLLVKGTKQPTGQSRWSVQYEGVFLHKPSGRHYHFDWSRGATEVQDEKPFEYDTEYEPCEVVEREVTVKQWVPV